MSGFGCFCCRISGSGILWWQHGSRLSTCFFQFGMHGHRKVDFKTDGHRSRSQWDLSGLRPLNVSRAICVTGGSTGIVLERSAHTASQGCGSGGGGRRATGSPFGAGGSGAAAAAAAAVLFQALPRAFLVDMSVD